MRPLIHQMMATAFKSFQIGKVDEAETILIDVLKSQSKNFDALHMLGLIKGTKNLHREALDFFKKALKIDPNNSYLNFNIAKAFSEIGENERALKYHLIATNLNPDHPEGWLSYGISLLSLFRAKDALNVIEKAINIRPNYADAWSNRGVALTDLNLYKDALVSFDKALQINPQLAEAWSNRGFTLHELKRLEDALVSYDRAIEIKHDYSEAYWNKSLALLLTGDLIKGWELYEWRWKKDIFTSSKRNFPQPLWLGNENIDGKTILLHAEQGMGDTIQFCRYAKLVKALGARVVLEVPKALLGLLSGLEGVDKFVEKGEALPAFDYHCPLMSLPLAFKTTIGSIPNKFPYILTNKNKQNKWQKHIGETGYKIAICWQGNTKNKGDVGRSFHVSLFEGLAKIDGVRLISLQKNEGIEQLNNLPVGMKVEILPDDFDSRENAFLDSTAVMKCVDLVITSDTALTHLAGALGVKSWLPLKYVPDYRWMLDRRDSPWYPNHRLFRQATRDDWTSVFNEMETELKSLISTKVTTQ